MRQASISRISYRPQSGYENQVEARTIADFRRPFPRTQFAGNHRIDFHALMIVTEGSGVHTVDFTGHELARGTVVWVRPGQVQRWADVWAVEGTMVIFPDELLPQGELAGGARGTAWHLEGEAWDDVRSLARVLRHAHEPRSDAPGDELRRATSRHALAALLLRLAHEGSDAGIRPPASPAFGAFRAAVEQDFARERRIAQYGRRLGYSVRTLERAVREATGLSPRQFVDERVLLEAKRMLAYSPLPAARVGASLGMDDASNFTAWFAARAGLTPAAFRRSVTEKPV